MTTAPVTTIDDKENVAVVVDEKVSRASVTTNIHEADELTAHTVYRVYRVHRTELYCC